MNGPQTKRVILIVGALLLGGLFFFRQQINGTRIVKSISLALGRPVQVDSVHVRLLPRPGFDLDKFVVVEDPSFGAEPVLQAAEVTASLRLSALLRGRMEIARLSLTEPSFNLVHNAGKWNLETVLERASQIQVAPTSKKTKRPEFPYIEGSHARINFKFGVEKKAYALTDAEFALWQDSEDSWGLRLRAQPTRTDFNLSDTGLIRVNGSWQRASTWRDTPLNFTILWEHAQLGQLTKLAYGNDKGWRGAVTASATLTGTPSDLNITTSAMAEDFRRFDVFGGGSLRLATDCTAAYHPEVNELSGLDCQSHVGDGTLGVTGDLTGILGASLAYNLRLNAQAIPARSIVAVIRHARQHVPDDLVATGQFDGRAELHRSDGNPAVTVWKGTGQTSALHFTSAATNTDLVLNSIPITLTNGPLQSAQQMRTRAGKAAELVMEVGPFHASLGQPNAVLIKGSVSKSGYNFQIQGETHLQRLLQAARIIGLPVIPVNATGTARIDLDLANDWSSGVPLRATGKAQLSAVQAQVRGLNAPLQISSATLALSPEQTKVQNLVASIDGTSWTGSLLLDRPCPTVAACAIHFDLHVNELATDHLNRLLNPNAAPQPWYRFLSSSGPSSLLNLNASGKLTAARIMIGKTSGSQFSANVAIRTGKLHVSDLHADVLGGKSAGDWTADFTSKPPQYTGTGTVEHVSLTALSKQTNDNWIAGSANASYSLVLWGLTNAELYSSAKGTMTFDSSEITLPRLSLPDASEPLQTRRLVAHCALEDGKLEVQTGKLETAAGSYQLSGTATIGRTLNLKLTRDGATGFNITGTLSKPRVTTIPTPETRAALKP